MGDEVKTEDLEDVSGGPDTVAPIITDDLEDVHGGSTLSAAANVDQAAELEDVDGGEDDAWLH